MSTEQPHFLYVEDDPHSREVLQMILTRVMGYKHIHFFENSENFMSRLQELPQVPDVIFLDIQIRPLNGYEILIQLRADPTYQSVKVIALKASVMVQDVARLQETGFDGLIGKPVAHKVFPRLLNDIFAGEPVWYIP